MKSRKKQPKLRHLVKEVMTSRVEFLFVALIIGIAVICTFVISLALVMESRDVALTAPDYFSVQHALAKKNPSGTKTNVATNIATKTSTAAKPNASAKVLGAQGYPTNSDGIIIPQLSYRYVSTEAGRYVYSIQYVLPTTIEGASIKLGHAVLAGNVNGTDSLVEINTQTAAGFTLLPDYRYKVALYSEPDGNGILLAPPVWITTPPLSAQH